MTPDTVSCRKGRRVRIAVSLGLLILAAQSIVLNAQEAEKSEEPLPAAEESVQTPPAETAPPNSVQQQLILVMGAAGTDEYREKFSTWSERWREAAERGGVDCTVIGQTMTAETTSDTASQVTDLQKLENAIAAAGKEKSEEPVWIVFLGHGTFDGRTASWNLNGPDITAEQLAEKCRDLPRPLAVVACASCTAPFVNALSGANRIIVTATKDGNQIQYSRFGDAMSQAIGSLDADISRDGQTSLLEAWLFASRRTAEFYKLEGRLATEHSLLDDNGDGKGVRAEIFEGDRLAANVENPDQADGRAAAGWHFLRSEDEQKLSSDQRKLRDQLEAEIELLRQKKNELPESDYLSQLEKLMLPLAQLYQSLEKPQTP